LTVTLTGTPAFSICFANAGGVGSSIAYYFIPTPSAVRQPAQDILSCKAH
jgi:hypothetical protein